MDIDLTALIGQPPETVVEYFEDKGYTISWSWRDTWQAANAKAFTVAGAMKMDVLQTIRSSVEEAIEEGTTLREFQQELEPKLRELGWWGRREIVNEETGEVEERQLGSPWRLRTIYRTNIQTSYNAGRYENQAASTREFLQYIAVVDSNTTDRCAQRHLKVVPADSDWWDENYPPNHWGCRARTRSLSQRAVDARGLEVSDPDALGTIATSGWAYRPGKAAFAPDLDSYDYRVARSYVEGVLSGAPFQRLENRLRSTVEQARSADRQEQDLIRDLRSTGDVVRGDSIPVAVLDRRYREMFGASTQVVQLSDDTMMKQLVKRPELTAQDYIRVQPVVERAQLIVKDRDLHRVFIREEGRLYRAVVKVTADQSEMYLQSFRRTNSDDIDSTRSSGEVVYDAGEL